MSNRNSRGAAGGRQPSPLDAVNSNPFVAKSKEKFHVYKNQLEAWLRAEDNFVAPYLSVVEQKTGINRAAIFLVLIGVITLYLLFGSHAGFLSHLITFAYPAIGSLRALETRKQDDDTKWLTYWVVFGFLGLFEHFGETVLSVLPFYYVIKTGFQLWLCLPGMHNGSLIIYERVLRPVAKRFLRIDMRATTPLSAGQFKGQIKTQVNNAADYVKETTTTVKNVVDSHLD